MKAEHRKELETNALADRMGRVVQGMKQAPQKRTLLYVMLAGVVVVGVVIYLRKVETQREDNSNNWSDIEDGAGLKLQRLVEQDPLSNQAKAAQYEIAYARLRDMLRLLATDPKQSLADLDMLEKSYRELARICKDDKVLLPEALFAQAVIEETRIMREDDKWKEALTAYKEVADNHKDSAFAKFARRRIEVLENKEKRNDLLNLYRDLRIAFVREERLPQLGLPDNHPPDGGPPLPMVPKPLLPKPESK